MDIEKLKTLVRDNPVQAAAGALAVLLIAGVVAFTIYLNGQGNNKGFAVEGSRLIVVKDGMTTADIAELLHEKTLVKNPAAFKMEARWKGLATKLQAGAYQIDGGMSNQQIVDVMVKGRIKQVRFTVPEGYSVAKTAKKLEAEGLGSADKFMAAAKDYAPYPYMQTDDSNVLFKAEGFIYPATYDFPVGISEQEMLKMMVAQFDKEMQSSGIAKTVAERNLPFDGGAGGSICRRAAENRRRFSQACGYRHAYSVGYDHPVSFGNAEGSSYLCGYQNSEPV